MVQSVMYQSSAEYLFGLRAPAVQTFKNPSTGENVKLSNEYAHAWANGSGEYVMSDTPGFNPAQVLRGNWTELQPVHR